MSIKVDGRYKITRKGNEVNCLICKEPIKLGDKIEITQTKRGEKIYLHRKCWDMEQELFKWQKENRV